MPYSYTALKETTETGLPMMRAMWLHYPDDPRAVAQGDQYLWGRDILVAPVVEKSATSRTLYLPRGQWFDFWTNAPIAGGREIERAVDLATIPLYVRAGAVIPTGPVRQWTDERTTEPMTLTVYPGANDRSELYEDDGHSFEYRRGAYTRVLMDWNDRARRLRLSLAKGSRMLGQGAMRFRVGVAGAQDQQEIEFRGRALEVRL